MKTIYLIIIIGVTSLVLGGALGFSFGIQMMPEQPKQPALDQRVVVMQELVDDPVLDSFCLNLSGNVTEINLDQNLMIISQGQDLININLDQNLDVARFRRPEDPRELPTRETITLEQVQVGDFVIIYAVINELGRIDSRGITVSFEIM